MARIPHQDFLIQHEHITAFKVTPARVVDELICTTIGLRKVAGASFHGFDQNMPRGKLLASMKHGSRREFYDIVADRDKTIPVPA